MLESVEALADFLVAESRTIEKGTESAKRVAKDEVPGDRIKDASALARELRWRVRLANGYASDEDAKSRRKLANGAASGSGSSTTGKKRKRAEEELDAEDAIQTFLHFRPRRWDSVVAYPLEKEQTTVKAKKPAAEEEGWADAWSAAKDMDELMEGKAEEVVVQRRRDVVVKVRRTAKGLERQRVERILEDWTWDDKTEKSSAPEASVPAEANGLAGTAEAKTDSGAAAKVNGHATPEDVRMEENGGAH